MQRGCTPLAYVSPSIDTPIGQGRNEFERGMQRLVFPSFFSQATNYSASEN